MFSADKLLSLQTETTIQVENENNTTCFGYDS